MAQRLLWVKGYWPNSPDALLFDQIDTAMLRHVQVVYQLTGYNKRRTASLLGISRSTLDRKLEAIDQRQPATGEQP